MSDPVEPRGPSRRWRIVLGVSLALNLLFVGLIAGAVLREDGKGHGHRKHADRIGSFGAPFMRALSKEDRRAIFQGMRESGALPDRQTRRAALDAMIMALRQTPFDPAAAEDVLKQQIDYTTGAGSAAQRLWLQRVQQMTDAERADYADRLASFTQGRR